MEACSRLSPIVRRIKTRQGYCELRTKGKNSALNSCFEMQKRML